MTEDSRGYARTTPHRSLSGKIRAVHPYLLHNGEIRDTRETLLSPGQVGFLNGWGVFSTLRVSHGVLFAFERHYARMQRDAELIRVPFHLSPEELSTALASLVEANAAREAVLRVAVIRNKGGLFEGPALTRDFDLIAFTADLADWGTGAHLTYLADARFGASRFSGAKITSWAQNLTCYEIAREQGYDEVILLNEHGQISECTSANIFVIKGQEVLTPPLSNSGCLPGVTRAILLEQIHLDRVQISERELTPSELEDGDTVFLTSTTRDLLPVLTVDGFPLRRERTVFSLLTKAFAAYQRLYVDQASYRHLVTS